jgi:AcrR family transcriptional regulator
MARQAERRASTRAAVLDAAVQLIRDRGYDNVSVAEIATVAGVSKGAVFYHFDSKEAVLDCLVDELQGRIAQRLADGIDRSSRPTPNSVAGGLARYLVEANDQEARQVVLIDGPQVLGWQRWREIDTAHFAGMTRAAIAALVAPTVPAASIDAATGLVLGAVMEAALNLAQSPSKLARKRKVDQFSNSIEAMLAGLSSHLR